jgi:queuine tRNA-ribosyltransferase
MLGPMLATIHNLHYYLDLMRDLREAIATRTLADFVAGFHEAQAQPR